MGRTGFESEDREKMREVKAQREKEKINNRKELEGTGYGREMIALICLQEQCAQGLQASSG